MTPAQIALLQRLVKDRPARAGRSVAAITLSQEHGVGLVVGRHVEYGPKDHEKAASVLGSAQLPTEPLPRGAGRDEASARPGISEKVGTVRPHADSVGVRTAAGTVQGPGGLLSVPAGGYAVLTAEEAIRLQTDCLLMVENLQTFRTLEQYRWIDYGGRNVLALYRGDTVFGLDAAAKVLLAKREPVWVFADFDPAGLAIALQVEALGRLERVVAPDLAWLEAETARMRRTDLFTEQEPQARARLDSAQHPEIRRLWKLLSERGAGLPQEWMRDAGNSAP